MQNIPEIKATDLNGVVHTPDSTYIILQSEGKQPYTSKIKLSELKKWILGEINSELEEVRKTARHADFFHQRIGGCLNR